MSSEYLFFLGTYALVLVVASLVVFSHAGQTTVLRSMERLGQGFKLGPWGLLHTFGRCAPADDLDIAERARLAESYIARAEEQTLHGARTALWILIAGCVACAVAALVIIGVLPPLVVSGAWSYETYHTAARLVVYGTTGGGLVMGGGLIAWLLRRTVCLNCADACAVTRDLYVGATERGVSEDLSTVLATGSYPRLSRMLGRESA